MITFLQTSLLKNPSAITSTIIMLVTTLIIAFFVKGLKTIIGKKKKEFFIYLIISLLFFASIALITSNKVLNDVPLNKFIALQIAFFSLGVLHFFAGRHYFGELSKDVEKIINELAFSILIICVGLIAFTYVSNLNQPTYATLYLGAAMWFIIPLLVVKCYEFTLAIPLPIYKKWFYPFDNKIDDPKDEELLNPLVISFEFDKTLEADERSNFRLKAPEKMEFGKLFYFFINDYNEKHPEHKIEYVNAEKQPYGWFFYKKEKWFKPMEYIDYARTINGNNINEDDVIICKRA